MNNAKCRWKCYDGQAKFLDELKKRQLIARKRGYGPDYVNLFVKHHKEKMREFARQRGICNPIDVGLNKWGLERRMTLEEERTRNAAHKGFVQKNKRSLESGRSQKLSGHTIVLTMS